MSHDNKSENRQWLWFFFFIATTIITISTITIIRETHK